LFSILLNEGVASQRQEGLLSLRSMNPQDAADHLLREIISGMIPQPAKQQGMPV
jgi:hypothetical protein